MGRGVARAALAVLALCAACAATLGGTLSAFNVSSTTPSASFTAAADWTAPTASAAVIGRTTAYYTGYIKQGTSYYVYADVTDTGNPASGVESVTANVDTTTSAHSAVALVAGSYTAGGVAYNYRTAALTANSTLAAGSYAFTITSTDKAANAETQSFTVTVDNTAPAASDVQSTNVSGGTVGHLDQGDTLTLTYNSVIDPYSILSGWSGASTKVQVYLVDDVSRRLHRCLQHGIHSRADSSRRRRPRQQELPDHRIRPTHRLRRDGGSVAVNHGPERLQHRDHPGNSGRPIVDEHGARGHDMDPFHIGHRHCG